MCGRSLIRRIFLLHGAAFGSMGVVNYLASIRSGRLRGLGEFLRLWLDIACEQTHARKHIQRTYIYMGTAVTHNNDVYPRWPVAYADQQEPCGDQCAF